MPVLFTGSFFGQNAAGGAGILDGLSPTAAWSASRDLLSSFAGNSRYTTATGVNSFKDQSGNARNMNQGTGGSQPAITTAGPNSRTCLDFDGSNDQLSGAALSNFISASAGYMIASVIFDALTTNGATFYSNDPVICDNGGFAGLHVTSASSGTMMAGNWDGNEDKATQSPISTATAYVVEWRHTGGQIGLRVNGGSWTQVASGNTTSLTGALFFGLGNITSALDFKLFEAATWSTVPSSGTQDTVSAAFMSWIGAV